jgi:hypothetical protein
MNDYCQMPILSLARVIRGRAREEINNHPGGRGAVAVGFATLAVARQPERKGI